jgi:Tfp pilus assembly protein PilO
MNKISKEKRSQMFMALLLTAGVIAGLWFGLISYQKSKSEQLAKKINALDDQIKLVQKTVAEANKVGADLQGCTEKLDAIENSMASGDLFSWMVSTLKQFNVASYKVEVPQYGAPIVADVNMIPSFPYRQATVAVGGMAYYYDLGKFIADLENHFPYMRVQNLTLEPAQGGNSDEKEKLNFRMEVVALVKSPAQ